jgi:hypothetical protein
VAPLRPLITPCRFCAIATPLPRMTASNDTPALKAILLLLFLIMVLTPLGLVSFGFNPRLRYVDRPAHYFGETLTSSDKISQPGNKCDWQK